MKKDIHPEYFPKAQITCACGAVYEVGSTSEKISIELCSACHPFFTGKQKIIDSARRVEKFQNRFAKKAKNTVSKKEKQLKRVAKKEESKEEKTQIEK